jgi:hypothetical protein
VRAERIELSLLFGKRILSPLRLPFRHARQSLVLMPAIGRSVS